MFNRRWVFALFLVAGCDSPSVVPVSGRVTLNGAAVENAIVLFQPARDRHNPGAGSSGRTDADGRFVLRQIHPDRAGVWPGKHRVTITKAPTPGNPENQAGSEVRLLENPEYVVPPTGTTDANFQVQPKPK